MSDNQIRLLAQVRGNMMAAVAASQVVVIDPAHYAVALARGQPDGAAVVVAKGTGLMAMKIREVGTQHAVGMLAVPALARALYHYAEPDGAIPPGLHAAVALALEWGEAHDERPEASPDTLARCAAAVPVQFDPLAPDA